MTVLKIIHNNIINVFTYAHKDIFTRIMLAQYSLYDQQLKDNYIN